MRLVCQNQGGSLTRCIRSVFFRRTLGNADFVTDLLSRNKKVVKLAGWTGLEPAAFRVTGGRYNQLNYHPAITKKGSFHLFLQNWQDSFL